MSTTLAPPRTGDASHEISFQVTGMTCASCVRRVEKALAKVDGVREASVNLANERARVVFDPDVATLDALRAAVERAGYRTAAAAPAAAAKAVPAAPAAQEADEHAAARDREIADLKRKWLGGPPAGHGREGPVERPPPVG